MAGPICVVLMPSGRQVETADGPLPDFDDVYREVVAPAIADAGLEPVRDGDSGGALGGPRFERLLLAEIALIDATAADFDAGYLLGARRALRSRRTVQIRARGGGLRAASDPGRGLEYGVAVDGTPSAPKRDRKRLAELLGEARCEPRDPSHRLVELVEDARSSEIKRLKTDVFRDQVELPPAAAELLAEGRRRGASALREARHRLGPLDDLETAVAVDLLLSFRAVAAWTDVIDLVEAMPPVLAASVMVREQYAQALNRAGRDAEAERVLEDLLASCGPNSETCSILGRIYKDRSHSARDAGDPERADRLLGRAIESYLAGFESDWRDAFPGINAIQLMELREPPDPRREELLPVVTYAVRRRITEGDSDYWDHATMLELAVLARDRGAAERALGDALAAVRETWEPASTASTLRRLRETRERRGDADPWSAEIEQALEQAARELPGGA